MVSGILALRSGNPFTVGIEGDYSRTLARVSVHRPNLRPGIEPEDVILGGADRYFDPAAFELQAPGTFGNVPRNSFTGPGLATLDLAFAKGISSVPSSRRTSGVSSGRLQRAQPRQSRHATADCVRRRPAGRAADQQRRTHHLDDHRAARGPVQYQGFMVKVPSAAAAGLAGTVLLLISTACAESPSSNASAAERPEHTVRLAAVTETSFDRSIVVTGDLAAKEEAVLSMRVPGRLESVAVDLGSTVAAGQALARLETTEFTLRVGQADAALRQARARLGLSGDGDDVVDPQEVGVVREARAVLEEVELTLARVRTFVERGISPRAELDSAEAAFKVAAADTRTRSRRFGAARRSSPSVDPNWSWRASNCPPPFFRRRSPARFSPAPPRPGSTCRRGRRLRHCPARSSAAAGRGSRAGSDECEARADSPHHG